VAQRRSTSAAAKPKQASTPSVETVSYQKSTVREYFESICVAVILALFVRTFVVQAFKIPTGSMENNLLIGDQLLVNKFVFAPTLSSWERLLLPTKQIKRGDIIVFKYPVDPNRDFVKRTIGLPRETVELRDKKVYINGKPLDEPYVHFLFPSEGGPTEDASADPRRNYGPVTVPPDKYFMMGDNRDNSEDSRYWGFMPREYVKGKALFIYFSWNDDKPGLLSSVRWSRLLHQIH
jgi:signal peptidase I